MLKHVYKFINHCFFQGFLWFSRVFHGETSHFSHGKSAAVAPCQVDDTCIEEAKSTLEELSGSTEIWSDEAWIYILFFFLGVLYIYIYKYCTGYIYNYVYIYVYLGKL